jgi:hypothetical protein
MNFLKHMPAIIIKIQFFINRKPKDFTPKRYSIGKSLIFKLECEKPWNKFFLTSDKISIVDDDCHTGDDNSLEICHRSVSHAQSTCSIKTSSSNKITCFTNG